MTVIAHAALYSGIISIPGSPKTWTWTLSPILVSKITEKQQNGAKVRPRRLPKSTLKSIKMDIWASVCPLGVPLDPGSPKCCPRHPRRSLEVSKMTVLDIKSDPFQQSTSEQLPVEPSHQLVICCPGFLQISSTRGPAAGAKP